MKKYIYIGIGGFLGAVSRYFIKGIHIGNYEGAIPVNTLMINVSGSLILALVLTVAFEIWEMDESIRLGIATGFLGAYTTFSTLCKETVALFVNGSYFAAISYIVLSTVLGLAAIYFGVILAREFIAKIVEKSNKEDDANDVV